MTRSLAISLAFLLSVSITIAFLPRDAGGQMRGSRGPEPIPPAPIPPDGGNTGVTPWSGTGTGLESDATGSGTGRPYTGGSGGGGGPSPRPVIPYVVAVCGTTDNFTRDCLGRSVNEATLQLGGAMLGEYWDERAKHQVDMQFPGLSSRITQFQVLIEVEHKAIDMVKERLNEDVRRLKALSQWTRLSAGNKRSGSLSGNPEPGNKQTA